MAKTTKPTKQQIAQAKARAGGNNPVKVTNAELKKLGSGALIAASFIPAGRAVKVAATAVKAAKTAKAASIAQKKNYAQKVTAPAKRVVKAAKAEAKANTRGLKAAQQPTRASKSNEVKMVNKLAEKNRGMGQKNPDAVRNAARVYDQIRGVETRAAARNAAAKTTRASKMQKKVTNIKKMEDVPKDVSDRFMATLNKLSAESAKKGKK